MLSARAIAQASRSAAPRASIAPRIACRSYAQAAASTRPPVQVFGVDGTYASALYTAAAKTQALDTAAKALENLSAVFKTNTKLQTILSSPTLTTSDKQAVVAELQKHIGGQDKGNVIKNFLNTLAENNRLGALEGVIEKFATLMGAARGEIELVITSASPLEQRTTKQLENAVAKSKYVGQGQKLKVVSKVNPDIKGGLVVEIGERTIDLSVSAKIAKMNKILRDTL